MTTFDLRVRHPNLYVPSDFMQSALAWHTTLAVHRSLPLTEHASFHVMAKGVAPVACGELAPLDPPDADSTYSAKVMLLASADQVHELYYKCLGVQPDGTIDEKSDRQGAARAVNFLVGTHKSSFLCQCMLY